MPRYFFHTQIGADLIDDPAGTNLRDPDEAWAVARDTIRAMMADPRNQTRLVGACLVVTDGEGDVVLEFPFAEAITAPPPGADGPASGTLH